MATSFESAAAFSRQAGDISVDFIFAIPSTFTVFYESLDFIFMSSTSGENSSYGWSHSTLTRIHD
jgi:hypothetical protein